jgi:hypothetical protein
MNSKIIFLGIPVILFIVFVFNFQRRASLVTPTSTPIAIPTPITSESKNITVFKPLPNDALLNTIIIKGEARVFENVFSYRIVDSKGMKLAEGHAMANAPDVGQFGPFQVEVQIPKASSPTGFVEVFSNSAKDGSEIDMVKIPVYFQNE